MIDRPTGKKIIAAFFGATLLALASAYLYSVRSVSAAPDTSQVAFVGARVIPGDGNAAIENATILVRDGKITRIGAKDALKIPKSATQVDLTGKTVMPMVFSAHVHIGYMKNGPTDPNVKDGFGRPGGHINKLNYNRENILDELRRYRYYGVGAVQSLGADRNGLELQIRDEQRSGKLNDPSLALLLTADDGIVAYNNGAVNGGPPFAPDVVHEAATPEQAREFVRQEAAKHVDVIKFWVDDRNHTKPHMSPEVYSAIIDEAHKQHLKAIAHIFYLEDAKGVARAGVDGIAHPVRDQLIDAEFIQLMKEHDTFQCSTMSVSSPRGWLNEPELAETVPQSVIDYVKGLSEGNRNNIQADPRGFSPGYIRTLKNAKMESDAGIRIADCGDTGGGDGWFPGYTEHREIQSLVDAGIAPMQAIHDGTQVTADILGLRDMDSLAAGKKADFIVLNANPLENIASTRKISAVYVDGKRLDRESIRTRWSGNGNTQGQ